MVAEVLETILEVPENQPTPDGLFMYHSIPCAVPSLKWHKN
jgi:NADH-quinone oxidoreductase subunit E